MRCIVVCMFAAACGEPPTFEDLIADHIDGATLVDCGRLGSPIGGPPIHRWYAARDCAIAASSAQDNFVVTWDDQGVEGANRIGFVGVQRDGRWRIDRFYQGYTWQKDRPDPAPEQVECGSVMVQSEQCGDGSIYHSLCLVCRR